MTAVSLQAQLFQALKTKLPAGASLAHEMAQLLSISTDSAYRRIRGEKVLTLEELHLLCRHYGLSVDALLQLNNGVVSFEGRYVNPPVLPLHEHLQLIAEQMTAMASFGRRELIYLCKDLPLFYHYHARPLAAFKSFFWQKTILAAPAFSTRKFSHADFPESVFALGEKALGAYRQMDLCEIWNLETLNSMMRQIQYCYDTGAYHRIADLLQVYESLEDLLVHLEKQAALGRSFHRKEREREQAGSFHLYYNEIMTGDNSIVAILDGTKSAYLTHAGINFLLTRDASFCENLYRYQQNLMRRSTLISSVSERERAAFFHELHKRIARHKRLLQAAD